MPKSEWKGYTTRQWEQLRLEVAPELRAGATLGDIYNTLEGRHRGEAIRQVVHNYRKTFGFDWTISILSIQASFG